MELCLCKEFLKAFLCLKETSDVITFKVKEMHPLHAYTIYFSCCSITNNLIYFAWFCFRMTVIVVQDVDEFHTLLCGETQQLVLIPHLSFASRVWPFPGVSSSRVSCLDLSHRQRRTLLPRFQFCKSCDDGASSGCR